MKFLFHHHFFGDVSIQESAEFDKNYLSSEFDFALELINNFLKYNHLPIFLDKINLANTLIVNNQKLLFSKISELDNEFKLKPIMKYSGLSATIIANNLLILSPDYFKKIRPEYSEVENSWARLIAHELAHIIHIEYLNGDESKMGPKWFYEGFAIHLAGNIKTKIKFKTAQEALKSSKIINRKSYAYYYSIFEFFLRKIELTELLENAIRPNFEEWLIKNSS